MAMSCLIEDKEYLVNHIRTKHINRGVLITTDQGSWAFLSKKEYALFKKRKIEEPLLSLLKEKGILLTEDNTKNIINDYRKKCAFLFQGASLHIVVPTLRCNHNCIYCHSKAKPLDAKGYDMDEKIAKKIVDFIFQSPSKAITIEFQGGEPLLRFDIIKFIIEYAKELNKKYKKDLIFRLVTNLTLMDENILSYLIKEDIGLCTSLDGNKEVHNKNRAEYDKTAHWIKKIKKEYCLNAMMLTTKHSLPYYKEIIDEYVKQGFETIWLKPINKLGYAKKAWQEISYSAEDYLEFWKKSMDYIIKINKKRTLRENYTLIILKKILSKKGYNFTDMQSPCGAAIGQLAYNHKGDVYTCDEGRLYDIFKLGTIDDSYKDLLTSSEALGLVMASTNDSLACDNCLYKPYCGVCPVCSYAEHKNIITKLPNMRCKIFKGMFDHIFEKLLFDREYKKVFLSWMS